jgi:RimJ/RimL family protein N-acetyltransferase
VAINCDFDNHPSIHGIERAGFLRVARLRSLIVANRWCIQMRSPGGLRICAL